MHYPFWYVPGLTSPMWIAIVAVLHVYIAMYAVGGSILLAFQTQLAYRERDMLYLEYLRQHAWFFVLITLVFSSLLGVGIWWTIGLASPLATEELIHVFVLGWAMEYVTFIVEIVAAFAFFYYWGRFDPKTHVLTGWIYAGAAFGSLVIITGITAFQLNTGSWAPEHGFWKAFWNPQTLPQIAARTGGSLMLGALYFFLHASLKLTQNASLLQRVGQESAKWAMGGAALTILGGVGWYLNTPPSGQAALVGASALNILAFAIFGLTAATVLMLYVGPIRNPGWLTPGFAILFFGIGHAATGTGEFIREAVRKPYIVYDRVLGNQLRPEEVTKARRDGYLNTGLWTKAYIASRFPEVISQGRIDDRKLITLPISKRRDIGRTVFQYHCNDCHSVEGYSAIGQLARGWSRPLVRFTVEHLDTVHYFMPPWSGTDAEAEVLTDYIMSIRRPYPHKDIKEEAD
jgi:cytochrome bd-type quinol oxidase subunit 1